MQVRTFRTVLSAVCLGLFASLTLESVASAQVSDVPDPEAFFGFEMGTDRKLARWDQLVEYYELLGEASDRLNVVHMGPTTLDNPFLALFFSSPENLGALDDLKGLNATLSDPRGASDDQIQDAISRGKAVIVQSMCLHSTEVASSQTAAELAYDMVTRDDDEMARIMDNTIGIMIPCFNPDGEVMVTDWYNETVGTDFEGVGPPSLYHHYIGHDNNRDAFMQNTVESQYGAQIIFRDWIPQAYVDHHQMGAYTARIYLPPYAEPIRPGGDPIVWREMSWYGAHMAYRMEEAGQIGAVNAAIYSGWGHFGFHWITPFHNIAGMLTESASARLATPLYVQPEQLGGSRQLPEYEAQTTFPSPWPGGWWRVRDIVDRQKIAFLATLDIAARNKETVLRSAYLKAKRQSERGAEGDVVAYIIPAEQHDPLTMKHMVNKLLGQGVEVLVSDLGFTHEGRVYGAGSYVVSMAQPKRGVIRWLLGQTNYPDNSYTRDREGNPIRPYDMSTDNLAEFMGVAVHPAATPVSGLSVVGDVLAPEGTVATGGDAALRIDGRQNAAFRAVNLLWNEGIAVRRADSDGMALRAGDFVVPGTTSAELLTRIANETGVSFDAMDQDPSATTRPARRQRLAMYQRYYGGNMDEGWTRWLLEDFRFPYTTLMDDRILQGNLRQDFDVIILPADRVAMMTGDLGRGDQGRRRTDPTDYPPEYRSGFGDEGVRHLEDFVRNGGTLVTFAEAGDLPIQEFDLPVRNALAGVSSTDFWSPGSTLHVKIDNQDRFAYGMPTTGLATFLANNQVYEVSPGADSHKVKRIVEFVDRDLLQSGWLLGEERIANRATIVSVEHGEGTVLLVGFRAQHRAQTHGTFKLVFNAFVSGPESEEIAAATGR